MAKKVGVTGKEYYQAELARRGREYFREAQRGWRARNPERIRQQTRDKRARTLKAVMALKAGVPCADCKQVFPPHCMDFDHIGPKNFAISRAITQGRAVASILAEAAKCELVCANCHRIRTYDRRNA